MADPTHTLSRLWLRQRHQDQRGHIVPGCSHDWGDSLCGLPSDELSSETGVTSACPECLQAWKSDASLGMAVLMLPRGDHMLLLESGSLQDGPSFNDVERRAQAITQGLRPLSPETFGPLGTMTLSRDEAGLVHGDAWCAEYDASVARPLPVGMIDGSAAPHHEGAPLHCWRHLPQHIEDAFFVALSVCRARNGVLSVVQFSGWGLHEAIRHEQGLHGAGDDVACESGGFEVASSLDVSSEALPELKGALATLVREHERTREVWEAVERVMSRWESSQEARAELGRVTLMLSLATENPSLTEGPDSQSLPVQSVAQYGIRNGPFLNLVNVCQVRVMVGAGKWISPLPADKRLVEDEVVPRLKEAIPRGREDEFVEDLTDFMVSQDHVLWSLAERYVAENQSGVLMEVNPDLAPPYWGLWPHGVDERGRVLNWVPAPVAKATPLEQLEASFAPFMPMTLQEAEALLVQSAGGRAR